MSDKKRFWLKLHKNYFNEDHMIYLESVENGHKYIMVWIKLLLMCLKDEEENAGFLRFSDKIPYDDSLLAKILRTDIDTIRVAMEYFQRLEMVAVLDDGTLYIEEVQKMIGRESSAAERMRKHRQKKKLLMNNKESKQIKIDDNKKELVKSDCYNNDVTMLHNKEEEEEEEVEEEVEEKIIDNLYKIYPTKCPISGRSTSKGQKCKNIIKNRLKIKTPDELEKLIKWYVDDCIGTKTYLKNFATFLNNLPDSEYLNQKPGSIKTKKYDKDWSDKYSGKLDNLEGLKL